MQKNGNDSMARPCAAAPRLSVRIATGLIFLGSLGLTTGAILSLRSNASIAYAVFGATLFVLMTNTGVLGGAVPGSAFWGAHGAVDEVPILRVCMLGTMVLCMALTGLGIIIAWGFTRFPANYSLAPFLAMAFIGHWVPFFLRRAMVKRAIADAPSE